MNTSGVLNFQNNISDYKSQNAWVSSFNFLFIIIIIHNKITSSVFPKQHLYCSNAQIVLSGTVSITRASDITRWCNFTQSTSNRIRSHKFHKINQKYLVCIIFRWFTFGNLRAFWIFVFVNNQFRGVSIFFCTYMCEAWF